MPRGQITIKFIGGMSNGEVMALPTVHANKTRLSSPTGIWTRFIDGATQKLKGGSIDKHWQSYESDVYEQQPERGEQNEYIYKFIYTNTVKRCQGITKRGTQCAKTSHDDGDYCPQHKR